MLGGDRIEKVRLVRRMEDVLEWRAPAENQSSALAIDFEPVQDFAANGLGYVLFKTTMSEEGKNKVDGDKP